MHIPILSSVVGLVGKVLVTVVVTGSTVITTVINAVTGLVK